MIEGTRASVHNNPATIQQRGTARMTLFHSCVRGLRRHLSSGTCQLYMVGYVSAVWRSSKRSSHLFKPNILVIFTLRLTFTVPPSVVSLALLLTSDRGLDGSTAAAAADPAEE
jgi:hypothetical protein